MILKTILTKQQSLMVKLIEYKELHSFDEAMVYFKECLNRGLEGIIIKSNNGKWKDGKPTWQWKVKNEITLDLKIVGFNYGTKGTKNEKVISSIQCQTEDGLLNTNPGGMNEKTMEYVTESMVQLLNTVVEVKCNGVSVDKNGNYSLLHPRVIKFRDDKNIANSLSECIEINDSCLN